MVRIKDFSVAIAKIRRELRQTRASTSSITPMISDDINSRENPKTNERATSEMIMVSSRVRLGLSSIATVI
jgi:hypothetical protein